MKHFKIIETAAQYPDVLIYRDREDETEIVKIMAIGIIDEVENLFADESILFESYETACIFIENFTEEAANAWCKKEEIKYW